MTNPRCQIGRIRPKAGGAEVRLLRRDGVVGDKVVSRVKDVLATHDGPVAGFTFTCWDEDSRSTTTTVVGLASRIPSALVPDFVRNRLLADLIETWTLQDLQHGD